jgi:hypothetical protein
MFESLWNTAQALTVADNRNLQISMFTKYTQKSYKCYFNNVNMEIILECLRFTSFYTEIVDLWEYM